MIRVVLVAVLILSTSPLAVGQTNFPTRFTETVVQRRQVQEALAYYEPLATGSTDANVGVVQGIPSIAVGRARGGDQHTLQEWERH